MMLHDRLHVLGHQGMAGKAKCNRKVAAGETAQKLQATRTPGCMYLAPQPVKIKLQLGSTMTLTEADHAPHSLLLGQCRVM